MGQITPARAASKIILFMVASPIPRLDIETIRLRSRSPVQNETA
jgi:hypothetical protein